MTTYKKFGERPSATVRVTEPDILNREPRVGVNWSSCGELSIAEAEAFLTYLEAAIQFAKSEANRIGVELSV